VIGKERVQGQAQHVVEVDLTLLGGELFAGKDVIADGENG